MTPIARLALKTPLPRICVCVMTAAAMVFGASAVCAQQGTPITRNPGSTIGSDASGFNNNPRDPEQARMLKDMSRERNEIRQKQIVEDTNQLLDLAKQLKDAVDKSTKDQLSLSVVNTANEIERLAKNVKEKMRDGQ